MRILSKPEVFRALQYAKSLPENEGAKILNRFSRNQPELCEMIFGGLAQAIGQHDQGMAHLFMDLCFDILCVYQRTQGELPKNIADNAWLYGKMAALQKELTPSNNPRAALNRYEAAHAQTALLEYLDMSINDFAAEDIGKREASVAAANLLFAVTRLFDAIYDEPQAPRH